MNDPANPLGWATWQRGAKLGLLWTLVFFVITGGVYFLMGVLGWSGVLRVLCAMGVGPVLAVMVIGVWWCVRRPSFALPDAAFDDLERTQTSRRTRPLRDVNSRLAGENPRTGNNAD